MAGPKRVHYSEVRFITSCKILFLLHINTYFLPEAFFWKFHNYGEIPVSCYRIACISCPTLYVKLLQMEPAAATTGREIYLLEFDKRFEIYGEHFVFYDYTRPLELPECLGEKSFDVVVADPPYLSEECLQKMAQTVKFLMREKVILCTGEWPALGF